MFNTHLVVISAAAADDDAQQQQGQFAAGPPALVITAPVDAEACRAWSNIPEKLDIQLRATMSSQQDSNNNNSAPWIVLDCLIEVAAAPAKLQNCLVQHQQQHQQQQQANRSSRAVRVPVIWLHNAAHTFKDTETCAALKQTLRELGIAAMVLVWARSLTEGNTKNSHKAKEMLQSKVSLPCSVLSIDPAIVAAQQELRQQQQQQHQSQNQQSQKQQDGKQQQQQKQQQQSRKNHLRNWQNAEQEALRRKHGYPAEAVLLVVAPSHAAAYMWFLERRDKRRVKDNISCFFRTLCFRSGCQYEDDDQQQQQQQSPSEFLLPASNDDSIPSTVLLDKSARKEAIISVILPSSDDGAGQTASKKFFSEMAECCKQQNIDNAATEVILATVFLRETPEFRAWRGVIEHCNNSNTSNNNTNNTSSNNCNCQNPESDAKKAILLPDHMSNKTTLDTIVLGDNGGDPGGAAGAANPWRRAVVIDCATLREMLSPQHRSCCLQELFAPILHMNQSSNNNSRSPCIIVLVLAETPAEFEETMSRLQHSINSVFLLTRDKNHHHQQQYQQQAFVSLIGPRIASTMTTTANAAAIAAERKANAIRSIAHAHRELHFDISRCFVLTSATGVLGQIFDKPIVYPPSQQHQQQQRQRQGTTTASCTSWAVMFQNWRHDPDASRFATPLKSLNVKQLATSTPTTTSSVPHPQQQPHQQQQNKITCLDQRTGLCLLVARVGTVVDRAAVATRQRDSNQDADDNVLVAPMTFARRTSAAAAAAVAASSTTQQCEAFAGTDQPLLTIDAIRSGRKLFEADEERVQRSVTLNVATTTASAGAMLSATVRWEGAGSRAVTVWLKLSSAGGRLLSRWCDKCDQAASCRHVVASWFAVREQVRSGTADDVWPLPPAFSITTSLSQRELADAAQQPPFTTNDVFFLWFVVTSPGLRRLLLVGSTATHRQPSPAAMMTPRATAKATARLATESLSTSSTKLESLRQLFHLPFTSGCSPASRALCDFVAHHLQVGTATPDFESFLWKLTSVISVHSASPIRRARERNEADNGAATARHQVAIVLSETVVCTLCNHHSSTDRDRPPLLIRRTITDEINNPEHQQQQRNSMNNILSLLPRGANQTVELAIAQPPTPPCVACQRSMTECRVVVVSDESATAGAAPGAAFFVHIWVPISTSSADHSARRAVRLRLSGGSTFSAVGIVDVTNNDDDDDDGAQGEDHADDEGNGDDDDIIQINNRQFHLSGFLKGHGSVAGLGSAAVIESCATVDGWWSESTTATTKKWIIARNGGSKPEIEEQVSQSAALREGLTFKAMPDSSCAIPFVVLRFEEVAAASTSASAGVSPSSSRGGMDFAKVLAMGRR